MEQFILMSSIQLKMLIFLIVGIICKKTNIINDASRQNFSDFVLYISLPCLTFSSFNQILNLAELKEASKFLAIAFAISFFSMFLGAVLFRKFPYKEKSILKYGTLVGNNAFIGMPIMMSAYGIKGLFYAAVFIIPTRIFMWTAGISLFTNAGLKTKIKNVLINPNIIATELGIIRMILHISLPNFIDMSIKNIGDCTTALSMILIGVVLSDINIKQILDKRAFYLVGTRLFLLPLVVLISLNILKIDKFMISIAVIMTGMPVGTTAMLLAKKYGADDVLASKSILLTTILSLVSIPIFSLFTN